MIQSKLWHAACLMEMASFAENPADIQHLIVTFSADASELIASPKNPCN